VIPYSGKNYLMGIPTHDKLVVKNDKRLIIIYKDAISKHQGIPFMPFDIEESKEYINQISYYILCFYGHLINGQKVIVTITDIKIFFDIHVSNNANIFKF